MSLDQGQRPAHGAFRGYVQHNGAKSRAAHPRVRDAEHVANAGACELRRNRQVTGLGHAGGAGRTGVPEHQDVVGTHLKLGVVDAGRQILGGGEHQGASLVLEEIGAEVIAEGIQSEEELQVLRALGVDFGQGFHLARPDAGQRG